MARDIEEEARKVTVMKVLGDQNIIQVVKEMTQLLIGLLIFSWKFKRI
jgi:hypothetical protein